MQLPDHNTAVGNLSALIDFSNNINSNLNLEFALNNLLLTCFGKLLTTKGLITLFDNENNLVIELVKGFESNQLKNESRNIDYSKESIEEFATKNNIFHIEKIISSQKLLGFLFLGEKFNKQNYSDEDKQFISTIVKIGSTTIRNAQDFSKLEVTNKVLDSKINQLNSIFDVGKEFGSILEIERVSKLLVYSISAQMLISKYAIVLLDATEPEIIESKYNKDSLHLIISSPEIHLIKEALVLSEENEFCQNCKELGVELIVPMTIKNEVKGLLFLGKRITSLGYSQSDIEYISSIASFAIISIENSRLFKEAIEKQKLEKDLEIARNIQQNLLPAKLPTSESFEIAAINKTAKMVGGDFYDAIELSENELLISIADVSGKGVQASLLMANLQAFLNSIYKQNYKLEEASNFLNDLVSENTTNGSFITFFWGVFDKENNSFTYVNMGHNPPLLIRQNNIIKLKKGGMILGVMKTIIPYEYETINLKTNDTIILFTDGITEAMNMKNVEYSDERLEDLTINIAHMHPSEILHNILEDVSTHTGNVEQSDDITCMVLKIK